MEFLDILKTAGGVASVIDFLKPGEKKSDGKTAEGQSDNMITAFLKKIGLLKETEKIQENAEKERAGIFTEAISSVLVRYFPTLSKITTLASAGLDATGVRKRSPEAHEWQNEIDNFTAATLFVPDSMLKNATDLFVNSEYFMKLLDWWPAMPKSMVDDLKNKDTYDPDNVINALRVIHQDISTGKVAADKVAGLFGANGLLDLAKKAIS